MDSQSAPMVVQLTMKASKTDPFRKGVEIVLGSTDDELCPVLTLFKYLRLRGSRAGPLFIWEDNTPLTGSAFVAAVRSALSSAGYIRSATCQYAGHSFHGSSYGIRGLTHQDFRTLGKLCLSHLPKTT